MANQERFFDNNFYIPPPGRVERAEWNDPERSPFVITRQTHNLIQLMEVLPDLKYGREYLENFTQPYLKAAGNQSDRLFNMSGVYLDNADPVSREPAAHAYAIMSALPGMTAIKGVKALEDGFSRKGILKPAVTKKEFRVRILELLNTINKFISDKSQKDYLEATPANFRTLNFFRVAALMTEANHLKPGEKEVLEAQREQLNEESKIHAAEIAEQKVRLSPLLNQLDIPYLDNL